MMFRGLGQFASPSPKHWPRPPLITQNLGLCLSRLKIKRCNAKQLLVVCWSDATHQIERHWIIFDFPGYLKPKVPLLVGFESLGYLIRRIQGADHISLEFRCDPHASGDRCVCLQSRDDRMGLLMRGVCCHLSCVALLGQHPELFVSESVSKLRLVKIGFLFELLLHIIHSETHRCTRGQGHEWDYLRLKALRRLGLCRKIFKFKCL